MLIIISDSPALDAIAKVMTQNDARKNRLLRSSIVIWQKIRIFAA